MRSTPYIAIVCFTLLAVLPANASAAETLFVSPTGSTTATSCPSGARCALEHAVEDLAGDGDVVELGAGNYSVTGLTIRDAITVRGEAGLLTRPRIVGTTGVVGVSGDGGGAQIQDLTVDLVGTGVALQLEAETTIERSQILVRGPGNTATDGDALLAAADTTVRDTTISANRSPAASTEFTVVAEAGTLTLRNVEIARVDNNDEPALGLGSGPDAAIDALGLTISARFCLDLSGGPGSVIRDLLANQRPSPGATPCVSIDGTSRVDAADINSTLDTFANSAVNLHDDSVMTGVTIDAPTGVGARIDENARLDRADVTAERGVELFGHGTMTNSLVVASGDSATRFGGPVDGAGRITDSTIIGGGSTAGFRKDGFGAGGFGTVEIRNTILAAGTDIVSLSSGTVISNSRYATTSGSDPITDGGGNTSAGPQFVDPGVANYRLQASSPLVDAGATHDLLGAIDLDRNPRVSGPRPDMGAYELQQTAPPADPPAPGGEQPSGEQPGPAGGESGVAPVQERAPSLSQASLRPRSFPAGTRNVRLRFTLSEPASVSIATARELPGRRSGRRCLKPSRRLRRAKRCTRLQRTGRALTVDGKTGANSVPFTGRGLKAGPHRLTITPTDAAGTRGNPATVRFSIVARRKKG